MFLMTGRSAFLPLISAKTTTNSGKVIDEPDVKKNKLFCPKQMFSAFELKWFVFSSSKDYIYLEIAQYFVINQDCF